MGASEQLESAMRSRRKRPRVTVAQKIKSGELTPDEAQQWRKRRRQEKNRQSAQLSRLRKKAYVEDLELRVEEMGATLQDMEARMAQLADENARLRRRLANRDATGDEAVEQQEVEVDQPQQEQQPQQQQQQQQQQVPPTPTPTAGGAFTPHTVAVTPLRELDVFFGALSTPTSTPKAGAAGGGMGSGLAAFLDAAVAPHDGSDSDSGSSVGRAESPLHMDSHHASVANGSAVPPREAPSSRGPQQWAFAAPMWLLCVVASLCAPQLHAARLPRHLRPRSMSTLRRARCSKDFALLWALTRGLSARSRHRLLRAVRTGDVRVHLAVYRDERRADVVVTRLGQRSSARPC